MSTLRWAHANAGQAVQREFLVIENRRVESSSGKRQRRLFGGRYRLLGFLLATAIAAPALYYYSRTNVSYYHAALDISQHIIPSETRSRSPAYLFGFAHAAIAGCEFIPGAGFDRLAASMSGNENGVVPEDVKIGFGDFGLLQQARGTAAACHKAHQLLGSRADLYQDVLRHR